MGNGTQAFMGVNTHIKKYAIVCQLRILPIE